MYRFDVVLDFTSFFLFQKVREVIVDVYINVGYFCLYKLIILILVNLGYCLMLIKRCLIMVMTKQNSIRLIINCCNYRIINE